MARNIPYISVAIIGPNNKHETQSETTKNSPYVSIIKETRKTDYEIAELVNQFKLYMNYTENNIEKLNAELDSN